MSFENSAASANKSKNEQSDFVVQVSGTAGAASRLGKKPEVSSPIEITSKLAGDRSGDVVSFDNAQKHGVLTVASIKPASK